MYCPESKFMFKTDDDTITDLNLLQELINTEEAKLYGLTDKRRIYGKIIYNARPKRSKESKWFLTPLEFRYPYFPNYCNGASCLFTKEAAKSILYSVPRMRFFWIDDVLFMGIIPKALKIELIDMKNSFGSSDLKTNWQLTCDFLKNSGLISFYLDEEEFEKMDELYTKCPPGTSFWKHFSALGKQNLELFF